MQNTESLCNKCGSKFEPSRHSTHIEVSWGYNSLGKDTLTDTWDLCSDCRKALNVHPPICVKCKKTIPEVMAYLYSEYPGSSFYLDYDKALAYYKTDNHCGLEYAKVDDLVFCEICYEEYIRSFKIPAVITCYMGSDPPKEEMDKQPDRIQNAINYVSKGDSLRAFYEVRCNRNDTIEVRSSPNKANLIETLRVEIYHENYKAKWRERGTPRYLEDVIVVENGCQEHFTIPCEDFLKLVSSLNDKLANVINLKEPVIEHTGSHIRFGEFSISSLILLEKMREYKNSKKDED